MSVTWRNARYRVFHRTWWKRAERPGWPNDREPCPGEQHDIGYAMTIKQAQEMCAEWNAENDPGEFSDKAEFDTM